MSDETLGTRLRRLRKERGLSLQDVADWFGINRASVYSWEERGKRPDPDRLPELARRLGVTVDELLAGGIQGPRPFPGVSEPVAAYAPAPQGVAVKVRAVVMLRSDGTAEEIPDPDGQAHGVQLVRTTLLSRGADCAAYLVRSSDCPAIRHGAAIIVSRTATARPDSLCVLTMANGATVVVALLMRHDGVLKLERMDRTTFTLMESLVSRLEVVIAVDHQPNRE